MYRLPVILGYLVLAIIGMQAAICAMTVGGVFSSLSGQGLSSTVISDPTLIPFSMGMVMVAVCFLHPAIRINMFARQIGGDRKLFYNTIIIMLMLLSALSTLPAIVILFPPELRLGVLGYVVIINTALFLALIVLFIIPGIAARQMLVLRYGEAANVALLERKAATNKRSLVLELLKAISNYLSADNNWRQENAGFTGVRNGLRAR